MHFKLFLCLCATYQIISYTAADKIIDDDNSNEDDLAIKGRTLKRRKPKAADEINEDDQAIKGRSLVSLDSKKKLKALKGDEDDDANFALMMTSTEKSKLLIEEEIEYENEKKHGAMTNMFGTNQHYYYPEFYKDLGRRFILQYPYKEISNINEDEEAEANFHNIAKDFVDKNQEEGYLIPVKASPEHVLAVASKAALIEAAIPHNHENYIDKEALRSGDYWNDVWREDANPDILRARNDRMVESVNVKVMPGSNLYKLVSDLKKISPRLVYVINKT